MANYTKPQQKEQRNYLKGSAKSVKFNNGGEIIHLDLLLEDLQNLPVNKSGYIKISVSSLPKMDRYGNTHSVFENTFVPDAKFSSKNSQSSAQSAGPAKGRSTNDYPF